ncbi:MAG: hypothetical protein HN472_10645 [Nitrospina sp.]|jgi:hypothetical protein|nr:hypothetical protein [Nitrospina sp.]MBT3877229.1 hypothetical protein [Nitrospina sp.]MBT4046900.1 hypothetical protein [Nitrospina sp.]MBT4557378.1 hypothetical protein [Nitrospina sp.]MBT5350019.1 hypothetical protein [Nitrospina sp.]
MKINKLIGCIFILIGFVFNEITLALIFKGWYGFDKVNWLLRLCILTSQVFFIFVGWQILKGRSLTWFLGVYRDMSLFLFNAILLVVLLLGGVIFKDKLYEMRSFGPIISNHQLLQEQPEVMKEIYPDRTFEEIREIQENSDLASHPVLELMEKPRHSKHYNVGFENMRYDSAVNANNAASSINGSTWVFGGSTTFGALVSDDDTIPAYLNRLGGRENIFINFGVRSYFLNTEIEKLLLLLKKGWRPKRVIFIAGLNDISYLTQTRFHPLETPARNPFGFNFSVQNFDRVLDSIKVAIQHRFPAKPEQLVPKDFYENVYEAESPYQKYPVAFFDYYYRRHGNANKVLSNQEQYVKKLYLFYRMNIDFLEHLGNSYGFSTHIFFQPIGLLHLENPHIKNSQMYQKWWRYKIYNAIVPLFQERLIDQPLPQFYDISDADKGCHRCYVDLTHYNSKLNANIAQRIFERLNSDGE